MNYLTLWVIHLHHLVHIESSRSKVFVNGEEEVKSLPLDMQQMFTLLTEEEFRLDISSTELRKTLEQQQKQ